MFHPSSQLTNEPNVRVQSFTTDTRNYPLYTVYIVNADHESDEIDLVAKRGTPHDAIRSAADYIIARDYDASFRVSDISERFGLFL